MPVRPAPRRCEIAIADFLHSSRPPSPRERTVLPRVLAMVCQYHVRREPRPTRGQIAEALNTTTDAVDYAISTALARGEVTEEHRTGPGKIARRVSVRRSRYLVPSPTLLAAYLSAR